MRKIWKSHPVLTSAFALAALATTFFLVHLVYNVVYWSAHANEPIRPWMTVGYVGKSWGINPRRLDLEAGLPPPIQGHPLTLEAIASQRKVPVDTVIEEVEAAIARIRTDERLGIPATPDHQEPSEVTK